MNRSISNIKSQSKALLHPKIQHHSYQLRTGKNELSTTFALLLIVIFFTVSYILQLGTMPLVSPDEPRYAEIPREMISSGNWTVPQFNGIEYFQKPVLGYWITAISEIIFGYNNFAVRFPSAFFTGLTSLLIYGFVRKFLQNNAVALFSALIYLSFGIVIGVGTYAVLDAQTAFFLSGSIIAFFFAYQSKLTSTRLFFLVLCGLLSGACFMIKGFLAFAVLAITVVPFLIWEKQWRKLFIMPWIPLITAITVCIPWGLRILKDAPDFWSYFIIVEHFSRFFKAENFGTDMHPESFWFFIPIIFIGMLPWTIHLPSVFLGLKNKEIFRIRLIIYALSWLIFQIIFFSASSGKLATYILPCFPPLSILIAYGLYTCLHTNINTKIFDLTNLLLIYILLVGIIGVSIYVILSRFTNIPHFWNFIQLNYALGIFAFMLGMLILSIKTKSPVRKILFFIFSPIFLFGFKSSFIPEQALASKAQGKFILQQEKNIYPDTIIIAYPNMMHAVSWYLKRNNVIIYGGDGGELEYWIKQPKYQTRYIATRRELQEFIDKNKNRKDGIAFFMRGKFREETPASTAESYQNGMMFSKF